MRKSVLEPLVLSDDERSTLERWARRPKSAQALALRCRIVLECAKGGHNTEVAERLGNQSDDGQQVAGPVRGKSLGRAARRAAPGRAANDLR